MKQILLEVNIHHLSQEKQTRKKVDFTGELIYLFKIQIFLDTHTYKVSRAVLYAFSHL